MSEENLSQFRVNLWSEKDNRTAVYISALKERIESAISMLRVSPYLSIGSDFYIRLKNKEDNRNEITNHSNFYFWKNILFSEVMDTDFEINSFSPEQANYIAGRFGLPFPFSNEKIRSMYI